jgi:hypothetical protein
MRFDRARKVIPLTKGPKPAILIEKAAEWTAELVDQIARGDDPTPTQLGRYRHPVIKDALRAETHRKCAYCESKPLHVTHGDVEHVVPKAVQRELTFEWTNLTLACDVCNTNKGQTQGLVDPYNDNPAEHLIVFGPMIFGRPGSAKGELTERTLKLNRTDLFERRAERLSRLMDQARRISETQNEQLRNVLKKTLIEFETADDREYAAVARAFVREIEPTAR